jgi:hypothetical protein
MDNRDLELEMVAGHRTFREQHLWAGLFSTTTFQQTDIGRISDLIRSPYVQNHVDHLAVGFLAYPLFVFYLRKSLD